MTQRLTLLENWTPEQAARMERNIFVAGSRMVRSEDEQHHDGEDRPGNP